MSAELWQAYVIFACAGFLVLPTAKMSVGGRLGVLLLVSGLGFLPVGGLSLAAYPRSLLDDLALTTVAWLGYSVVARVTGISRVRADQRMQIILCFALIALFLYPATLGLTYLDPYRLGYAPRVLLVVMFLVTIALWIQRNYLGAALITVATLGFTLDIKASGNYWDYLIDPLLGIYCWSALLSHWYSGIAARRSLVVGRAGAVRS